MRTNLNRISFDHLGQDTNGIRKWSDNSLIGGQQFAYQFDTIGNRRLAVRDGRMANYSVNLLNQITSRTVPGYVPVIGEAAMSATVKVNNQTADQVMGADRNKD